MRSRSVRLSFLLALVLLAASLGVATAGARPARSPGGPPINRTLHGGVALQLTEQERATVNRARGIVLQDR